MNQSCSLVYLLLVFSLSHRGGNSCLTNAHAEASNFAAAHFYEHPVDGTNICTWAVEIQPENVFPVNHFQEVILHLFNFIKGDDR